MLYKIDTKQNLDIITPQMSQFKYIMADELVTLCAQLQKNDKSAIIDFNKVVSVEDVVLKQVEELHKQFYNSGLSFVLCNLTTDIKGLFSTELNVVPTQTEAIDLVSMEGLERELLGEL